MKGSKNTRKVRVKKPPLISEKDYEKYADRYGFSEKLSIEYRDLSKHLMIKEKAQVSVIPNMPRKKIKKITRNIHAENEDGTGDMYILYINMNRKVYHSEKHGYYIIMP